MDGFGKMKACQQFILIGNEDALKEFYGGGRRGPVLGSERFRERVGRKIRKIGREYPRYERMSVRPTVERLLNAVGRLMGCT